MEENEDYNPETDLFLTPELIPADVQAVIARYEELSNGDDLSYTQIADMLKDVQLLGYTFDYYLDAIPFELRKLPD